MRNENQPEMVVHPISPAEITQSKIEQIPDKIIEVFNELITENYVGRSANVYQEDVVSRLVESGFDRQEIYRRGWLNVEEIYQEQGWKVDYDKPGYNETYRAYFTFSAPRR